jgi:probable phosphoglycerate mutase
VTGARWLELPAARGGSFTLGTAAVCELGFERERRVVRVWNDTSHLR